MTAIAIDGPAGAGKSTLARRVAANLGFIYVDTGALYRTVGLKLLKNGITADNEAEVAEVLKTTTVDIVFKDGEQRVILDGEDVGDQIRTPEASMMASKCSALPVVRSYLLDMQRSLAEKHSVVMDGRDIATVVLPNAKVKIFLTADIEERARRRYEELLQKGTAIAYDEVLEDMKVRDFNDSNRAIAPLKPSETSIIVNTTGLEPEKSLERLLSVIKQNIDKAGN